jgi:hypothetical protein
VIERGLPSPSNFLSVGPARIVAIALACGLLANSLPSSRSTCSEDALVSRLIDMKEELDNAWTGTSLLPSKAFCSSPRAFLATLIGKAFATLSWLRRYQAEGVWTSYLFPFLSKSNPVSSEAGIAIRTHLNRWKVRQILQTGDSILARS